jgi:hypothetical protein
MTGIRNPDLRLGMLNRTSMGINVQNHAVPAVTVEFCLQRPDNVTVRMYDLFGREVASLVNKYFGFGAHNVSLSVGTLANGRYMVKMLAGSNTLVKGVQIVR